MRRKRLAFFSAALALLVLAGLGVVGLLHSPLFTVNDIGLTGSGGRRDFLLALAGIHQGESIWQIDPAAVERRLLSDPRLAAAAVRLRLPRTVEMAVRWRRPVALIILGSRVYGVDGNGVLLPAPPGADLPFITGISGSGRLYSPLRSAALTEALLIWNDLNPAVRGDISEIHCQAGRIRLYTLSGTPIRLGHPADLPRQLAPLLGILENLREHPRPVALIDLSLPGRPLVDLQLAGNSPAATGPKAHG